MGVNGCVPAAFDVGQNGTVDHSHMTKADGRPHHTENVVLDHDSRIMTKSVKRTLSPRLVSFKGLLAPSKDLRSLKSRAMVPLLVVAAAQIANLVWQNGNSLSLLAAEWEKLWSSCNIDILHRSVLVEYQSDVIAMAAVLVTVFLAVLLRFLFWGSSPTYLLDYACFKPADEYQITKENFIKKAVKAGFYTEKSLEFQKKILASSGLGEETYIPPSMHVFPTDFSLGQCMKEAEMVLYGVMDEILAKSGVKAHDIGILVVNCSVFCPIPSLSAMVVNHFKLREDIETYNLGGMGCSAGVIAISLARDLLKVNKNTYAVVLSTEVISGLQGYTGNDRSMMVGNCIFRWGASAVLLSNKRGERRRAKYELMHVVRTHKGADDRSFQCVRQVTDSDGIVGVSLSKDLMSAAGVSLKTNITTLAPKILPLSEKLKFASNFVARKFLKMNSKPYTPNFMTALDHFCIHPGGKAVLDGIEKNLQLSAHHMEPSRMSLHRFGNTSSSSIWYVLAYMEAKNRVRQGDLVWQIALGSGIKCNSAIWKSLKSQQVGPSANPWLDCVDKYPMPVHATSVKM